MARPLRLGAQGVAVALVAGLLGLLAWKVTHQTDSAARELARGKHPVAPAFRLERLDGRGKLSLAAVRGQVKVLNFWATWCDPCRREAPLLAAAHRRWSPRGVSFVGVDVQDVTGDARRFVRKHGITYPNVRDRQAKTALRYGASRYPETFILANGRVVDRLLGQLERGQLDRSIQRALQS